jgi:uncharacterized membrane protein
MVWGKEKRVRLGGRFVRARLIYLKMSGSYWFRPLLLIIMGIILSQLTLYLDEWVYKLGYSQLDIEWIIKVSPLETARSGLISGATVLLGLFGVLLSLALIPLTIATSAYGNVILKTFLRDKGTQNVIGFFAFVIFFDIFASGRMPLIINASNYPGITVTVSYMLLLGSLIATIYFFNHIAHLLQATYVSKIITDEILNDLEVSFIDHKMNVGDGGVENFEKIRDELSHRGTLVRSKHDGYVTGLNYQYIFNKAEKIKATVLVLKLPGDYVAQNEPLVRYISNNQLLPHAFDRVVNRAYTMGESRTVLQDVDYGVQLLTIIASKALSPAINDPITATICIDKIGQVLSKVVSKQTRSPYILDSKGELRMIADPDDFRSLMGTGFNQIRQYGCKQFEIMCHQLYAIETIAYAATRESDRQIIKYHADLILEEAMNNLTSEWSKDQVRSAYQSSIKVIGLEGDAPTVMVVNEATG